MRRVPIFLPDELHEKLRQEALRAGTSLPDLIRDKLQRSAGRPPRRAASYDPILKVAGICRGRILSGDIDDSLYGG